MHTFRSNKVTFIYNSDLSGDVTVQRDGKEIKVPGEELLEFVAERLRAMKIDTLEHMHYREVLGLPA